MAAEAVGELRFHFAIHFIAKFNFHLVFREVKAAKFAGKHYPADGEMSTGSDVFLRRPASRFIANGVRLAETKSRAQQASDDGLYTLIFQQ